MLGLGARTHAQTHANIMRTHNNTIFESDSIQIESYVHNGFICYVSVCVWCFHGCFRRCAFALFMLNVHSRWNAADEKCKAATETEALIINAGEESILVIEGS